MSLYRKCKFFYPLNKNEVDNKSIKYQTCKVIPLINDKNRIMYISDIYEKVVIN